VVTQQDDAVWHRHANVPPDDNWDTRSRHAHRPVYGQASQVGERVHPADSCPMEARTGQTVRDNTVIDAALNREQRGNAFLLTLA